MISGRWNTLNMPHRTCRIKAILFALVRAFEFELAVPAEDVVSKQQTIVLRPFVTSEPDSGSQLPLIVKPYRS